jgi:asparaginyl-tRNA synthetase
MERRTGVKAIWTEYRSRAIAPDYDPDMDEYWRQELILHGQIDSSRSSGTDLCFIDLVDGTTVKHLQCVCSKESHPDLDMEQLQQSLHKGTIIQVRGYIIKSKAKGQPIEFDVHDYRIVGEIQDPGTYPFAMKGYPKLVHSRQYQHLRTKELLFMAIELIKQSMYYAFHESMRMQGLGETAPVLLTEGECEGGAFPFRATILEEKDIVDGKFDYSKDFFKKPVYLTVSSQLHLEATVLSMLQSAYCMTTACRAEPSTGRFHAATFCMPECEVITSSMEEVMQVAESALKYCMQKVFVDHMDELEYLEKYRMKAIDYWYQEQQQQLKSYKGKISKKEFVLKKKQLQEEQQKRKASMSLMERLQKYTSEPFGIISHETAVSFMLDAIAEGKVTFTDTPAYDDDFSKEHEHWITDVLFEGMPVFVIYYPKAIKSFYMPVIETDGDVERVECFDLLFPEIGEVVGGSMRIHEYEPLIQRIEEKGMDCEQLEWYIDTRKYCVTPHGGFGIGFERFGMAITGMQNIRDLLGFVRAFGTQLVG